MNHELIQRKLEETHGLLEQMYTVLGLRWVYRFLRLYGVMSEWLHAGLRSKLCMTGGWIQRLFGRSVPPRQNQAYRFAENLSTWMAQSHRNLDEIRRRLDAMPQSEWPDGDDPITDAAAMALGETPSLTPSEYSFLSFKQEWLRNHAVPLPEIQTSCNKGLVSVVLPVFNGEDFVSKSIESVLAQSYSHLELIVVDDGSTDGTSALVDSFASKDSRVRVLHQANQKLPRALNAGFRSARGEFFTWTSADNIMHPDCLARLTAELQQHPQTAMVYANMRLIDETGAPNTEKRWYADVMHPEHVVLPECILKLNTVCDNYIGAAFLYRASAAFALGGYSPNRFGIEDYDFWLRMNECFELRHTAFRAPVYDYRFHSKSLTARNKQLDLAEKSRRTMQWDAFRRQYLSGPAFWRLDDAAMESAWGRELAACIEEAGHVLVPDGAAWQALCKNPGLTTIGLTAGRVRSAGAKTDLSAVPACRAIVSAKAHPVQNADGDVYISLSPVTGNDFLPDHRGWFHFDTIRALFAFLDTRAKNACLLRMETISDQAPSPDRRQGSLYRTKYTRHWITPEGDPDSVQPVEWLCAQLAGNPVWVSVIVPACDVTPHLDRCVESIVRQTVRPIEIILACDENTGKSGVRCGEWAAQDGRIRVIRQKNGGLSGARNAGIDAAQGKYLAFVDPDDRIEPGMLEKLLFAAEACNAGIAECSCDSTFPEHMKQEAPSGRGWLLADRHRALWEEVYLGRVRSIACNKIYRRELFTEDIRYPVGKYFADAFLTHRLFYRADRLVSMDDVLYHCGQTLPDSIAGQDFYRTGADRIEALRMHSRFLKEHKEEALYSIMLGRYAKEAMEFLEQCRREKVQGEQANRVRTWLLEDRKECAANDIRLEI